MISTVFVRGCHIALLLLLAGSMTALGQEVVFRTLDTRTTGLTVEVDIHWTRPFKASLDSLGESSLSPRVASAVSGGVFSESDPLSLPGWALPEVRLVSADFDEASIPRGDASEELLAALAGPPAVAEHLGTYRKQAVASLRAQLVLYDPETQTLRRYRRMRIEVDYRGGNSPQLQFAGADARTLNPHVIVTQSVLADGTVYRIPITEEGVYRIDRAFLTGIGLNPDTIEPNQLKVYGNGGAPVPALNSAPRAADLLENPVFVRGGGDGAFGEGDVLLFYGAAPKGGMSRRARVIGRIMSTPSPTKTSIS